MQVTSSVCTLLLQYIKSAAASANAQSINEHPKSIVIFLTWACYYGNKTNGKFYGLVSYAEGKLRLSSNTFWHHLLVPYQVKLQAAD